MPRKDYSEEVPFLDNEFTFKASRSSGAGGQHVNKVSSRVELRFNIPASSSLSEDQKQLLIRNLESRLTKDGDLIVSCETSRSQYRNKISCIRKLYELISTSLIPPKERHLTKPTRASRKKRIEDKKAQSEKKARRKPPLDL